MKLLQTVVSSAGFRSVDSNADRLELFEKLLQVASRAAVPLLVIPAGFLTAQSENEVPALIGEMERRAKATEIAVIGGVDVVGQVSKKSKSVDDLVRAGQLPFFGFAIGKVMMPP